MCVSLFAIEWNVMRLACLWCRLAMTETSWCCIAMTLYVAAIIVDAVAMLLGFALRIRSAAIIAKYMQPTRLEINTLSLTWSVSNCRFASYHATCWHDCFACVAWANASSDSKSATWTTYVINHGSYTPMCVGIWTSRCICLRHLDFVVQVSPVFASLFHIIADLPLICDVEYDAESGCIDIHVEVRGKGTWWTTFWRPDLRGPGWPLLRGWFNSW